MSSSYSKMLSIRLNVFTDVFIYLCKNMSLCLLCLHGLLLD